VCVCVYSPQIAVRLLVHKIYSQEWEALQALTVSDVVTLIHHHCSGMSLIMDNMMCVCVSAGTGGVYEELWAKISQRNSQI